MKILVIGPEKASLDLLVRAEMEAKFGKDVEIYTPEQAQKEGLTPADFGNLPTFKIKANPIFEHIATPCLSGRESRRQRRAEARRKRR